MIKYTIFVLCLFLVAAVSAQETSSYSSSFGDQNSNANGGLSSQQMDQVMPNYDDDMFEGEEYYGQGPQRSRSFLSYLNPMSWFGRRDSDDYEDDDYEPCDCRLPMMMPFPGDSPFMMPPMQGRRGPQPPPPPPMQGLPGPQPPQ